MSESLDAGARHSVMRCTLTFNQGKWRCKCPDLIKHLKQSPDPDPGLVQAIEAFHNRYYPDEQANRADYPWIVHKQKNGIEELEKRLKSYELTWHWRMLLPSLRVLDSATGKASPEYKTVQGDSVVLCVSQVRQWQLMSCFQMKWPEEPQDLAPAVRRARKTLLRPPVFGKSHRITRLEVYAALYEPGVLRAIKDALEAAHGEAFRVAHILGRHDSYFRVDGVSTKDNGYVIDIQHVIDLEPEQAPIEIEQDVKTNDVCRPYGLVQVAQFADRDGEHAETRELLFSSDSYCRTVEQISEVLNDPSARSILIIAPPGSGKEDLSKILHRCRPRGGSLVTASVAGLDDGEAAQMLFEFVSPVNCRVEVTPEGTQPRFPFEASLEDGAVFKALGGTLVIDELDKASAGLRGMLLRFLENNEVAVPGASVVLKLPPHMRFLCVFTGSMSRGEFLQLKPIDLWSRITRVIEMQHPLATGEPAERLRAAEDYLRLFWLNHTQDFFKGEKLIKYEGSLYEPLRHHFIDWWKFFCSRAVGEFVCRELAGVLCGPGQPLPSIRSLRGTAGRCFNLLFHALLYHKVDDSPLERWRQRTTQPTGELKKLLDGTARITRGQAEALAEIRSLIRSSATLQV